MSNNLCKLYQRLLQKNSLGNALYFPVKASELSPGSIGYFNQNGQWYGVGSVLSLGIPYCRDLSTNDTGSYGGGQIHSANVKSVQVEAGIPVE
jgi:hypothetical protein